MKFSTLSGWKITGITTTAVATIVRAAPLTGPPRCRHCGAPSGWLRDYGETMLRAKEAPEWGKPIEIWLTRRRYECSACNRISAQPMPGAYEPRQAAVRLLELAAQRALHKPTWLVAEELGFSEKFVRAVLTEEIRRLEGLACFEAPRHLGLDFIKVNKRERVLLVDAESHSAIGITRNTCSDTILLTLLQLPGRAYIETVTIPISNILRSAVLRTLPRAMLIVDRFRVMGLGKDALESVRGAVHLCLSRPKDKKVLEATAFFLTAKFIDVFRTESSAIARRRYAEWVAELPGELTFAFGPVVRTVDSWSEHIFGYFDHHFPEANRDGDGLPAEATLPC